MLARRGRVGTTVPINASQSLCDVNASQPLCEDTAARGCDAVSSPLLGLLDVAYNSIRMRTQPREQRWFAAGYGDLRGYYNEVGAMMDEWRRDGLASLDAPVAISWVPWAADDALPGVWRDEGSFESPLSHALPEESRRVRFLFVRADDSSAFPPSRAVVVHMACTGACTYTERERELALPLLAHGIASIIVMAPYNGSRQPAAQNLHYIDNVRAQPHPPPPQPSARCGRLRTLRRSRPPFCGVTHMSCRHAHEDDMSRRDVAQVADYMRQSLAIILEGTVLVRTLSRGMHAPHPGEFYCGHIGRGHAAAHHAAGQQDVRQDVRQDVNASGLSGAALPLTIGVAGLSWGGAMASCTALLSQQPVALMVRHARLISFRPQGSSPRPPPTRVASPQTRATARTEVRTCAARDTSSARSPSTFMYRASPLPSCTLLTMASVHCACRTGRAGLRLSSCHGHRRAQLAGARGPQCRAAPSHSRA
jgi:hypothetical protein